MVNIVSKKTGCTIGSWVIVLYASGAVLVNIVSRQTGCTIGSWVIVLYASGAVLVNIVSRNTGYAIGSSVIVGLYASGAACSNIQVVEAVVAGYKR